MPVLGTGDVCSIRTIPTMSFVDDDSRWALMSSRFETPDFIRDEMRCMMRDFVNSLPVDSSARLMWAVLPEPPGWGIYSDDDNV